MAVMGKKAWAVCCGALRNKFELYLTLASLCEYRSRGLLEGIVLSTWKGEVERIAGLREKLESLGIEVVELEPLDEAAGKFISLNFARQAYQLRKGLEAVPDDCFVLKCRTDYSIERIADMEPVLQGKVDFTLGKHGAMCFGLNYRIGVWRLSSNLVLYYIDAAFVGYKLDLMQMTKLTMTKYSNDNILEPDEQFFINLFIDKYPILNEMVSLFFVNQRWFADNLAAYSENKREEFELPGMLNKVYALHFIILANCVCLIHHSRKDEDLEKFYLADAFGCSAAAGKAKEKTKLYRFMNPKAVQMIVGGECVPTEGYRKLLAEIIRFAQEGYAEKCTVSKEDYDETCIWVKEALETDPKTWLSSFPKKRSTGQGCAMDFQKAAAVLMEDGENLGASLEFVLEDCARSQKGGFYGRICKNFDFLDRNLRKLHLDMMNCAGRCEQPWILKKLAKCADMAENVEEGKWIGWIFERWGTHELRLYAFPMEAQQLSALYTYGVFQEERCGTDALARVFCRRLSEYYGVPLEKGISCYSEAIIKLIRDQINQNYTAMADRAEIRYLIDFWIDERAVGELSHEAAEALKGYALYRRMSLPLMYGEADAYEKLLKYAGEARTAQEAQEAAFILLREKDNVSENVQRQIDDRIIGYVETGLIESSVFTKAALGELHERIADGGNNKTELSFWLADGFNDEQFIILCRILGMRGKLAVCADWLRQCCDSERKLLALRLFEVLEKEKRLHFFSYKADGSFWLNLSNTKYRAFEKKNFILPRNGNGYLWPYAQKYSESPFAAFLKMTQKGLMVRAEFTAVPSLALRYFVDAADGVLSVKEGSAINRLNQHMYPVSDDSSMKEAIDKACGMVLKLGTTVETIYDEVIRQMGQEEERAI